MEGDLQSAKQRECIPRRLMRRPVERERGRRSPESEKDESSDKHEDERENLEDGEDELCARAGLAAPSLHGRDGGEGTNAGQLDRDCWNPPGGFLRVEAEGGVEDEAADVFAKDHANDRCEKTFVSFFEVGISLRMGEVTLRSRFECGYGGERKAICLTVAIDERGGPQTRFGGKRTGSGPYAASRYCRSVEC